MDAIILYEFRLDNMWIHRHKTNANLFTLLRPYNGSMMYVLFYELMCLNHEVVQVGLWLITAVEFLKLYVRCTGTFFLQHRKFAFCESSIILMLGSPALQSVLYIFAQRWRTRLETLLNLNLGAEGLQSSSVQFRTSASCLVKEATEQTSVIGSAP